MSEKITESQNIDWIEKTKKIDKEQDKALDSIKDTISKKESIEQNIKTVSSIETKKLQEHIEIIEDTKKKIVTEKKKAKTSVITKREAISSNDNEVSLNNSWKEWIEKILWDNAFTRLLKQLSQLFAMLIWNLTWSKSFSESTNINEKSDIEDWWEKVVVKKDEEKIDITNDKELDNIYSKFTNYAKYRSFIQSESSKLWISQLEVIKLLTKENNTADSTAYWPWKNTSIYWIGQMSNATWRLVEKEFYDWKKMDRKDTYTQIAMAIRYMKYIKNTRQCSDAETKFFYNAWHNFELTDEKVSKSYISWNLKSIVYQIPKYRWRSVNYIASRMTKKEYYYAAMAYYDGVNYSNNDTMIA